MNVQKVYVTIDLADGDTVYEPITDVLFDSEVSDKDFNHVRNARLTRTTASLRTSRGR